MNITLQCELTDAARICAIHAQEDISKVNVIASIPRNRLMYGEAASELLVAHYVKRGYINPSEVMCVCLCVCVCVCMCVRIYIFYSVYTLQCVYTSCALIK